MLATRVAGGTVQDHMPTWHEEPEAQADSLFAKISALKGRKVGT